MIRNSSIPSSSRDLGAGPPRDDDRLDPRQVPFEVVGELPEEQVADDRPEDRIAQELQPLVRDQPVIGPRGVRQRLAEEGQVPEAVADDLLAIGQRFGIVAVSRPGHGRTNKAPKELRCGTIDYKSRRALSTVSMSASQAVDADTGAALDDLRALRYRRLRPTAGRTDERGDRGGSLRPGDDSTPLATSTIQGRTRAIRSATFSGVRPPARIRRGRGGTRSRIVVGDRRPGAARHGRGHRHRPGPRPADGPAPRPAPGSRRRPSQADGRLAGGRRGSTRNRSSTTRSSGGSCPCNCTMPSPSRSASSATSAAGRSTKTPDDGDRGRQCGDDLRRDAPASTYRGEAGWKLRPIQSAPSLGAGHARPRRTSARRS